MSDINLLPWRQIERERIQQAMHVWMVIATALGLLFALATHQYISAHIQDVRQASMLLQHEIDLNQQGLKTLDLLKKDKNNMLQRMNMIHVYQSSRTSMINFLIELEKIVPMGVYLTSLQLVGNLVSLHGFAESNTDVSTLMRHIERNATMHDPKLTQIKRDASDQYTSKKLNPNTLQKPQVLSNEFQLTFTVDGTIPADKKDAHQKVGKRP
jgi:type IV pilus assembly protein PilN